jgi:hypothetical protein
MTVIGQIFQYRCELAVEIFDACILIDVQVQEVAERVVVSRKVEHGESLIQRL